MKKYLNKTSKGAIIVEASFIMPMVIVVIMILLYMSLFEIEKSVMYSQAQIMSDNIAHIIANPGLEDIAFSKPDEEIDKATLDKLSKKHDPYRYLHFRASYKNKASREQELKDIISTFSILNSGKIKPSIEANNKCVTVKVDYKAQMPAFVRIVGIGRDYSTCITAKTYVNDPVEFVRNTDMAIDAVHFLLKKLHLDGKVEVFLQKVKDIKEKIF